MKPLFAQEGSSTGAAASVKITQPADGQEFRPEDPLWIEMEAVNPNGNVHVLEIYDGTNVIHTVDYTFFQQFFWDAPLGAHTITVHAKDGPRTVAISDPVHIRVDPAALPMVSVNFYAASFEPAPYADSLRGTFFITRTQRVNEPLIVFLKSGGAATPQEDYAPLPEHIVFPAGIPQVRILVEELDDETVEGDETLTLEVIPPPPGTETAFPTNYLVGPSATGTIIDNESPNALPHLEIITPQHEQLLQQGSDIEFKVIARDPKGFIPKLEIISQHGQYPGLIGISEKNFDPPPSPGTPITHSIILSNAPPRKYFGLLVRGYDAAGNPVTTNRITILIGPNPDRVTLGLFAYEWRPTEAAERLKNGLPEAADFYVHRVFGPTNQAVQYSLTIQGTAENGKDYQPISLSGVLEAGVGYTNIFVNPIPDGFVEGPETVVVRLVDPQCWTTNSANAATNPACYMVSTNSQIAFTIHDAPPTNVAGVVLSVEVVDDEASEPPFFKTPNDTARFRVRRVSGPLNEEVRFGVEMSGEAWNGTDYQRLDRLSIMPANQSFIDIFIRPTADINNEGTETVIFTVIDYDCGVPGSVSALAAASATIPSCYDIAGPNSVQASIIDSWSGNRPPRATILYPPDGAVVEEGEQIVIEVHAFDQEGMLHSVGLLMDDEPLHSVYPAQPGTGTNMIYTGQVQFFFSTNAPVGEHILIPWAWDYIFLQAEPKPVRVFVRAKDAPKIGSESPLAFEQGISMADGTVRFKLRGGVGQVCRLETSSDLANWQSVSRLYLSNGQLDYIDRQPGTKRYFRLLEE